MFPSMYNPTRSMSDMEIYRQRDEFLSHYHSRCIALEF